MRAPALFSLLVTMAGCGSRPSSPPAAAPPAATSPATSRSTSASAHDLALAHKSAYERATARALGGDVDAAIRELAPFAAATAESTEQKLAYWIHNELTWLQWGRHDLAAALAETDLGGRALDRLVLPADAIASMRLHALWDRAYLLLELSDPTADAAFSAYEVLAKARDDHDGLAVLTAFFAARRNNGHAAMEAATLVDVDKDSDLQDLYVIALALDAGGDAARARAVRLRVCRGNEYLMKPLIVAQMKREGFGCP